MRVTLYGTRGSIPARLDPKRCAMAGTRQPCKTWPRRRQTSSLKSPRRFSLRQAISATKALGGRGRRYDGKRRCPTGAFGKKKHAASFVPGHGQNKLRVIACGPLRPALAVPRASAAGMGYCNDARRNNSTAAKPSAVRTTCSVVSASRDWNIWVDVPPSIAAGAAALWRPRTSRSRGGGRNDAAPDRD